MNNKSLLFCFLSSSIWKSLKLSPYRRPKLILAYNKNRGERCWKENEHHLQVTAKFNNSWIPCQGYRDSLGHAVGLPSWLNSLSNQELHTLRNFLEQCKTDCITQWYCFEGILKATLLWRFQIDFNSNKSSHYPKKQKYIWN